MAFFQGSINSKVLDMETSISVILPHDRAERPENGFPVMYLLHGLSDNYSSWTRFTSIERYANERSMAVVMPEVQRSFYTDMKYGLKYFSYVSRELPEICRKLFDISHRREDTFVAGLSMGGYGAVKCALSNPDVFYACASLSGALDVKDFSKDDRYQDNEEFFAINAGEFVPENDLFYLSEQVAKLQVEKRPKIYFCCGKEDFLYSHSLKFKAHLESLGLSFVYVENKGDHNWSYWDENISDAMDFFIE